MKEQHIARLKELFYTALSKCNCGVSCQECLWLKAQFLGVITDILNETEVNPYTKIAKGFAAVDAPMRPEPDPLGMFIEREPNPPAP